MKCPLRATDYSRMNLALYGQPRPEHPSAARFLFEHRAMAVLQHRDRRGSAHSRGYGVRWRKARLRFLVPTANSSEAALIMEAATELSPARIGVGVDRLNLVAKL